MTTNSIKVTDIAHSQNTHTHARTHIHRQEKHHNCNTSKIMIIKLIINVHIKYVIGNIVKTNTRVLRYSLDSASYAIAG